MSVFDLGGVVWSPLEVKAIVNATRKLGIWSERQSSKQQRKALDFELHALLFETLWVSGRKTGEVIGTRKTLRGYNNLKGKPEYTLDGLLVRDIDFESGKITWFIEQKHKKTSFLLLTPPSLLLKLGAWIKKNNLGFNSRVFETNEKKAERILGKVLINLVFVNEKGQRMQVKKGSLSSFRKAILAFVNEACELDAAAFIAQHSSSVIGYCLDELFVERLFSVLG